MHWWEWLILGAYAGVSLGLFVYAFQMYVMLGMLAIRRRPRPAPPVPDEALPPVTVQLPMYNERWVARRVIRAAAALDYPDFEIQVLDDSDDETRDIVDEEVARLRLRGVDIQVVRRPDRAEYKAGALKVGLARSRGRFIAIFDADFVPASDWLRAVVPELLADPRAGWVQTRWGHLNAGDSWMTRALALGIDGHFAVEQPARIGAGWWANFNGTAGIWRRETIEDAGGWTGDTLTEDLDLSYRAQLRGWRMVFREDVVVPAELPSEPSAIKSQQFRWAKGSIQTARKLLGMVWRSPGGWIRKTMASIHLLSYAIHPLMLASVVLAFPMLLVVQGGRIPEPLLWAGSALFILGSSAPVLMYSVAQIRCHPDPWRRLLALPVLMSLGMAIALSTSRAVFAGFLSRGGEFVRTPKRGDSRGSYRLPSGWVPAMELLMGLTCACAATLYSMADCLPVAGLLGVYASGFASLGILSWTAPARDRIHRAASAVQSGP